MTLQTLSGITIISLWGGVTCLLRNQEEARVEFGQAFINPSFLGHMIIIEGTTLVFLITPHCFSRHAFAVYIKVRVGKC